MTNTIVERLRAIATKLNGGQAFDLETPEFSDRWNWAWYVDSDMQNLWPELSEESRLVAYIGACYRRETDQGLCPFP